MHSQYTSQVTSSEPWFSVGYLKDDPLRQRTRRSHPKPRQIQTPGSFNLDLDHFLRHCGQKKSERRSSLKRSLAVVYLVCAAKHAIREGWHKLPPCTIEGLWGLSERASWQALRDLERCGCIETRLVDHPDKQGETITEVRFIPAPEGRKDRLPIPLWFVESSLSQIQTPNQLIVALMMLGWISAGHPKSFSTAELLERSGLTKHALARTLKSSAFRNIKHGEWAINRRNDTSANLVTLTDSQKGPQIGKVTRFADTTGSSVLVGTLGSVDRKEKHYRVFPALASSCEEPIVSSVQSAEETRRPRSPMEISPDGDLSAEHTGASSGKKTFGARGGATAKQLIYLRALISKTESLTQIDLDELCGAVGITHRERLEDFLREEVSRLIEAARVRRGWEPGRGWDVYMPYELRRAYKRFEALRKANEVRRQNAQERRLRATTCHGPTDERARALLQRAFDEAPWTKREAA